jgi:hypothetical protein
VSVVEDYIVAVVVAADEVEVEVVANLTDDDDVDDDKVDV